jgi:hypothetical protein
MKRMNSGLISGLLSGLAGAWKGFDFEVHKSLWEGRRILRPVKQRITITNKFSGIPQADKQATARHLRQYAKGMIPPKAIWK